MKTIFDYQDYRHFLKDWYQSKKKTRFAYSYEKFSKVAGFASPNFLKQVMDKHRNLSEESVDKFINALQLDTVEAMFFKLLVKFTQETNLTKREELYRQLITLKQPELKDKINQFKEEIKKMVAESRDADEIFNLTTSLIPLMETK